MAKASSSQPELPIDLDSIDNLQEILNLEKRLATRKEAVINQKKIDAKDTISDLASEFGKSTDELLVWLELIPAPVAPVVVPEKTLAEYIGGLTDAQKKEARELLKPKKGQADSTKKTLKNLAVQDDVAHKFTSANLQDKAAVEKWIEDYSKSSGFKNKIGIRNSIIKSLSREVASVEGVDVPKYDAKHVSEVFLRGLLNEKDVKVIMDKKPAKKGK